MNNSHNNFWEQSSQPPTQQQGINQWSYPQGGAEHQPFPNQQPFHQWYQAGSVQRSRSLVEEDTRPLPAMPLQRPQSPQKKRGRKRLLIILSILVVAVLIAGGVGAFVYRAIKHAPLALQTVVDVPLSGGTTRFDYQNIDPQTGLLFISRAGDNSVVIFDTKTNKVVGEVHGIFDGHGVIAIPERGVVYASAGAKNEEVVIDEHTQKIVATIPTGAGPDGLAYDPVDGKVFVSNEDGHSDTVIDVHTQKPVGTIALGGEAGNTQYDSGSNRIFVNVQTLNQLFVIDPTNYHIIGRYALPGCEHNHGLNIDAAQRIAFIACDGNAKLLVMDLHTMKVTDTASVGSQPDVLALDASQHMLYVAAESGFVSIFQEQGTTVHKLKEGFVASFAHTIAVNQQTHDIYLPLQDVNGKALIRVARF